MRSWLVISATGVVAGGAAFALGVTPLAGLAGAALAAVVRALAGDAPAALTGAVLVPVLAVASFAEAGGVAPRAAIALAAAGWTVVELARIPAPSRFRSPLVALVPAALAAVLDPSFAALIAIAGARLVASPWPRPRLALAIAGAGALVAALAAVAGTVWPALGAVWFGGAARPVSAPALAALAGDALGPITAVAALAGLASLARARYAELAVAAAIAGALLCDVRAGAIGPATTGLAALLAGLAVARFAALIRIRSAQAIAGAAAGALVAIPPAWTAVEQRSPAAHIGHASR